MMAEGQDFSHVVLLVSDDPYLQEEARFGFPQEVAVVIANDSQEALTLMETGAPSAVIVELRSGNSGGFALARDMSQRTDLQHVPVFIILERPQDEWLAREAGAATYRTQPIDAGELVAETMALLSAR